MSSKALVLKESRSISLFPSESEWAIIKDQATTLVRSGLLPKAINSPEKAIAIALKGRDLGIPMMHAFAHIFVTEDGKIGTTAELMLSLINRNCTGAVIDYIETTAKRCEIEAKRPGRKAVRFSFTIEEASRAGLQNKFNWQKYPAAMLRARAVAIAARAVYPDAIMGMSHLADELGAETDEDGHAIDIPAQSVELPAAPEPAQTRHVPAVAKPRRDRKQVGSEIRASCQALRLDKKEVDDWVQELFGKATPNLSLPEMEKFLETLQSEMGRNGVSQ